MLEEPGQGLPEAFTLPLRKICGEAIGRLLLALPASV